jgi:hypothetical protein
MRKQLLILLLVSLWSDYTAFAQVPTITGTNFSPTAANNIVYLMHSKAREEIDSTC